MLVARSTMRNNNALLHRAVGCMHEHVQATAQQHHRPFAMQVTPSCSPPPAWPIPIEASPRDLTISHSSRVEAQRSSL